MDPIYIQWRDRARRLLSEYPPPLFYSDHSEATSVSRRLFESDPLIRELLQETAARIEGAFGHGMSHAVKVALDAGALIFIEGRDAGDGDRQLHRLVLLAHCAGLLHDIERIHPQHAEKGAQTARKLLASYNLSAGEALDICSAIRNHEAFQPSVPIDTKNGALLSDCLYDADKFRWGPDNFYDTVWDMVDFFDIPPSGFVRRYPKGMKTLIDIRGSFRTRTGRIYGPHFIDIGLSVGKALLEIIRSECPEFFDKDPRECGAPP